MIDQTNPSPLALSEGQTFIKDTTSLCPECLKKIPAKVYEEAGKVWMVKRCDCSCEAGNIRALLATDRKHYYLADDRIPTSGRCCCSPGAGSCGDGNGNGFENHSCNMLIEIVQRCNLSCPTCYANSSPQKGDLMELDQYRKLIDGLIEKGKGDADLIQLSGGEPTIHTHIFEMIQVALDKGIKRVYINTNGIKLSAWSWAERLKPFADRISIYLQFDGFRSSDYAALRGRDDLLQVKLKALVNCERLGIDTVPTFTLTHGINEDELGEFIHWAQKSEVIRKVMIQPAMYSGRYENPKRIERLTVADVARLISAQTKVFSEEDFSPIPCSDPNCFSMAAAIRTDKGLFPVSRYFPKYTEWHRADNIKLIESVTDTFDSASGLLEVAQASISQGLLENLSEDEVDALLDQMVELQESQDASGREWRGIFAIGIKPFMDAYTYDQDRIEKCCVHIISKDGTPVSFCHYNAVNRPQGNL